MVEFFVVVFIGFVAFTVGVASEKSGVQEKCVAKYAYMPHSDVGDFCKTILKFEKDPK